MNQAAKDLIHHYDMALMETENIYFTQTYVSSVEHNPQKPIGSAIVALMTADSDSYSDMHKLPTDEIWHFYLGDPIELLLLHPDGSDELRILGTQVLEGQLVQTVVPAGSWMGARLRQGGQYGLFGCTMAPGFTPDDFVAGEERELVEHYPSRADMISAMIRSS